MSRDASLDDRVELTVTVLTTQVLPHAWLNFMYSEPTPSLLAN